MKSRHQRTLELLFARPTPGGVKWAAISGLLLELGAELVEREGSRVAVVFRGQVMVLHRPHPSPDMDKGAVAAIRKWFEELGVRP